MVRRTRSRCFIALVSAVGAAVLPGAGAADTGGIPVDPSCISVLPALTTTCPQPASSQPQPANVASTQSSPSSQTGAASVTATPELARSLLVEVNRTRRAYGLRPLAYSARLANAATEHSVALATAGMFTHDWPTTGRFFSSWIRTYYPLAAIAPGAPAKTWSGHPRDSLRRVPSSSGSTAPLIAACS